MWREGASSPLAGSRGPLVMYCSGLSGAPENHRHVSNIVYECFALPAAVWKVHFGVFFISNRVIFLQDTPPDRPTMLPGVLKRSYIARIDYNGGV